jgi:hypothetical protein
VRSAAIKRAVGCGGREAASASPEILRTPLRTVRCDEDPIPHRRADDGSRWQIFPGDLDLTLNWKPETDLAVVPVSDEVSSHALVGEGGKVCVIPAGESWPVSEVRSVLKDG